MRRRAVVGGGCDRSHDALYKRVSGLVKLAKLLTYYYAQPEAMSRDNLAGLLQQKYGIAKEHVEK